ncbi:MAG: VOC family protein [Phycisphaerae bacterium]
MSAIGVPAGYHTLTPYVLTANAAALIDFLIKAFDGVERVRMARPDGSMQHAQVAIGDSVVMLGEPKPPFVPTPASVYVYVGDADAVFQRAIGCGATIVIPIADQFYGDRMGGVRDPLGNLWWIATRGSAATV